MNEEKCERARGGIKSIHANACFGERLEKLSGGVEDDEDTTRSSGLFFLRIPEEKHTLRKRCFVANDTMKYAH